MQILRYIVHIWEDYEKEINDYLPHFKYQMIRLHDYSNGELLAKGDEIEKRLSKSLIFLTVE